MIKGKFIEKCKSQNLRRVLLKDPPEKLEQLISVARAHEEAYRQANMMKEKTVTCGKDIIIQNQAEIQHSDQHMMPKLNSVQMQTNRNKNVHDAVNGLIQAKTVGLRAKLVLHLWGKSSGSYNIDQSPVKIEKQSARGGYSFELHGREKSMCPDRGLLNRDELLVRAICPLFGFGFRVSRHYFLLSETLGTSILTRSLGDSGNANLYKILRKLWECQSLQDPQETLGTSIFTRSLRDFGNVNLTRSLGDSGNVNLYKILRRL
ncbi:hypothetical protein RRG08_043093 [Elysia crispata]|uniref:Uncharacterized protein n=1 Tax=Elysia crispata TaxID=231223 RepID=A0AAE1CPT5_9GAST|nr:hypothetical protein RRG08_043093 [Elysia crispata]